MERHQRGRRTEVSHRILLGGFVAVQNFKISRESHLRRAERGCRELPEERKLEQALLTVFLEIVAFPSKAL